jgi:hypothetical protein
MNFEEAPMQDDQITTDRIEDNKIILNGQGKFPGLGLLTHQMLEVHDEKRKNLPMKRYKNTVRNSRTISLIN